MAGLETGEAFRVDDALSRETLATADMPLCRLLLRDEARFPWLVLVPRRLGPRESFDLLPADRARLWAEAETVGQALLAVTGAAKLNLAAFGNLCPQLHIHLVARTPHDAAWPQNVIGLPRESYAAGIPAFWPALLARLSLNARANP